MIDDLFVVLGAGASYDCAGGPFVREGRWRPPLVRELFAPRFQAILSGYPFAQAAAADIVPLLDDGTFQIERHIATEFRAGTHELARRKYLSLPLYLQEVLHTCGGGFAWSPDAYDRMLTGLSEVPHVTFVTLNYDTILDDRLANARPRKRMGWYVDPSSQWWLVKLHGSVDWGYRLPLDDSLDLANPLPELEYQLGPEIELRVPDGGLDAIRGIPPALGLSMVATQPRFYPAISVPVGAADELVCPQEHVGLLKSRLHEAQPVHLLVIGYSGLDQEVVQILRDADTRIASLTVVDKGDAADAAMQLIAGALQVEPRDLQFHGVHRDGFYAFTNDALSGYVSTLRAQAF
jgi:hypothetical protein